MPAKPNPFAGPATGTLLALLCMFFWGSLYPTVKLGYQLFAIDTSAYSSIILFAGLRFAVCGLALLFVVSVRARGFALPRWPVARFILPIALFAYGLHYICVYIGVSLIDSAKAAILKQVGPLFLVCFAFLFRREDAFSMRKLVGGILGFMGIIVVNLHDMRPTLHPGDWLILLASCFSVCGMVVSKRAYDKAEPLFVTAWAQLLGGMGLCALGFAMGGRIGVITPASAVIFAYICTASCLGYALWNLLLKHQSLSRLNLIKYAEPLFGAVCAAALLGEDIVRLGYLAAFVLVSLGILIGREHPNRGVAG